MESSDASTTQLIAKNQLLAALADLNVLRAGASLDDIVYADDGSIDVRAALDTEARTPEEIGAILGGPTGLATALIQHSTVGPNASQLSFDKEHCIIQFTPQNKFTGPAVEALDTIDVAIEASLKNGDPLYAAGTRAHLKGHNAAAHGWGRLNAEILPQPKVPAFKPIDPAPAANAASGEYYGLLHSEVTDTMVNHIISRTVVEFIRFITSNAAFLNLAPSQRIQIYASLVAFAGASYSKEPLKKRPYPEAAAEGANLSRMFFPTPEILNLKFEAEKPSQVDPVIMEMSSKRRSRGRATYVARKQQVAATEGATKEPLMIQFNTSAAFSRLRDELVNEITGAAPPALLIEGPFRTPDDAQAAVNALAEARKINTLSAGLTTSVVERGVFHDIMTGSLMSQTPQSLERAAIKRKIKTFDSVILSLVQIGRHINHSNHVATSIKIVLSAIRQLALLIRANDALPQYSRDHGLLAITEIRELIQEAASMSYRFWAPDAELAADILAVAAAVGLSKPKIAALKQSPVYGNKGAFIDTLKNDPAAREELYRELRHISAYARNYFNDIEVVQSSNPVEDLKMPLQILADYQAKTAALIKDAQDNEALNLALSVWNSSTLMSDRMVIAYNSIRDLCGPDAARVFLGLSVDIRGALGGKRSEGAVLAVGHAETLVNGALDELGVLKAKTTAERLRRQLKDVAYVNGAEQILALVQSDVHSLSAHFGQLWDILGNPNEHLGLGPLLFTLANLISTKDLKNAPVADALSAVIREVHFGQLNMLTHGDANEVLDASARVKTDSGGSPLQEFVQVLAADIITSTSGEISRALLGTNQHMAEMGPPPNAASNLTHNLIPIMILFPLLGVKTQAEFAARLEELGRTFSARIDAAKLKTYQDRDGWARHHFYALRPEANDLDVDAEA